MRPSLRTPSCGFRDLNKDGDALDASEVVRFASPKAGGGAVAYDLFFDAVGTLYCNDTNAHINRYVDLNNDGDALDAASTRSSSTTTITRRTCRSASRSPSRRLRRQPVRVQSLQRRHLQADRSDSDGDANDAGEVTVFVDNTGPRR